VAYFLLLLFEFNISLAGKFLYRTHESFSPAGKSFPRAGELWNRAGLKLTGAGLNLTGAGLKLFRIEKFLSRTRLSSPSRENSSALPKNSK
jgi:hypothetical protein